MLYHSVIFNLAPCSIYDCQIFVKEMNNEPQTRVLCLNVPPEHRISELGQFSSDSLFQWLFYHYTTPIISVRQPWPGSTLTHSRSLSFELHFCGPALGWLKTKTGNDVNRLKGCDTVVHLARHLRSLTLDKHYSLKCPCLSNPDPHLRKQTFSTPVSVVKRDVNLTTVS